MPARKYTKLMQDEDEVEQVNGPINGTTGQLLSSSFVTLLDGDQQQPNPSQPDQMRPVVTFCPCGLTLSKSRCSLLGGILIVCCLVSLQTMSNSGSYIISYMIKYAPDGKLIDESNIMWMGSWNSLASGISSALGGYIEYRWSSARRACLLGSSLYCIGVLATRWTINWGYHYVVLSYGILPGIGSGIAWTPAVINSFGWYPKSKGLASGVIMAGYGLGAFVFNYLITLIVNPDNLPASSDRRFEQDEVLARVPYLFIKLGLAYFALQLAGCALLFKPPAEIQQQHLKKQKHKQKKQQQQTQQEKQVSQHQQKVENGQSDMVVVRRFDDDEAENLLERATNEPGYYLETAADKKAPRSSSSGPNSTWSKMLSRQFAVLFITTALASQAGVFLSSMQKQYGQTHIKDDHFLSQIGSLSSLAVCVGKLVWGFASDKLPYVYCYTILTCIMVTTVLLLPQEFILSNHIAFALCILMAFSSMYAYSVILNVKCYKTFGQRHATLMTGLIWTSSIFNIPSSMLLGDLFITNGHYAPCWLLSLFTLLSELILLAYICYYKKRSWN